MKTTKQCVEAVELPVPETAVERDPCRRVAQRRRLQAALPDAPGLARVDQAGVGKHAQVLGHRGQGHVVRFGQLHDGAIALRQFGEDRAPGRVGERAEGGGQPGV